MVMSISFGPNRAGFLFDAETFGCRFLGKSLISYIVRAYNLYREDENQEEEGLWERYEGRARNYDPIFTPTPKPWDVRRGQT